MHGAIESERTLGEAIVAFQLHKSLGLTVLALSLARLAWRVSHQPPPLPAMARWRRAAAHTVHWAFYALMIAVPLSGWAYVSAQWRGDAPLDVPTLWFGLFEVPHLFDAQALPAAERKAVAGRSFAAHMYLAWTMAALAVLHAAAALRHHFGDRDRVLANMLPATGAARYAGAAAMVLGCVALAFAVLHARATGSAAISAIGDLPGADWSVRPGSEIRFSGSHAGAPFRGRFTRWRAGIRFDPADPAAATVTAEIHTGSARDGDPLHEETLPQAEWFDVARHPTASFRSTGLRAMDTGRYELDGILRIKDRDLPVTSLALSVTGERLVISGQFTISRRAANLGMESDPDAEYVSDAILVDVRVDAVKIPD